MTAANVSNLPTAVPARLPMPQGAMARGITPAQWRVLGDVIFPSAKSPESILLAVDYCRARGLDVFKNAIHIVPVWNSSLQREVETIWPGINEVQITAARTNAWAGMDAPKWGPAVRRTFRGNRKIKNDWKAVTVELLFPEWCQVTVYRIVGGQRCPFTEQVFWQEAYSRIGGKDSELPTDMWVNRPYAQLHKCTKAAVLRAAFPEDAEYTAEEMEGKVIDAGGIVIEPEEPPAPPPPATFDLWIPGDDLPLTYPKTKRGIQAALDEIGKTIEDGGASVIALNEKVLAWMAQAGFKAEVESLTAPRPGEPEEDDPEPDDDEPEDFPGDVPPKPDP